jgi:acetyl-CoA carboxylase carboxyltransferase component
MADDDEQAMMMIRELMGFLPSNNMEDPPVRPCTDSAHREDEKLQTLIPDDPNKAYDIKEIILSVVDDHNFFEVQQYYAQNIVIGFGRLNGKPVGFVANQPAMLAGVLDIDASLKAARFVRFCDAFNIPIITLADVPGFLPGTNQEFGGIIKHGAKLIYAYAEATVPKITIITRKAYGGAYCVMSSKHLGGDINYTYPSAEIAVMGPDGAVNILYRNKLSDEEKSKAVSDYRETFCTPYKAAELGYIDEVIYPAPNPRQADSGPGHDRMANSVEQMKAEKENFNCFVAETPQKEIVGYAAWFFCYFTWIGKSLYLDDLYVKPSYRSHGLGKRFINTLIETARSAHCHKIRWQVANWNKPAIDFYKKLGVTIDTVNQNCDLNL